MFGAGAKDNDGPCSSEFNGEAKTSLWLLLQIDDLASSNNGEGLEGNPDLAVGREEPWSIIERRRRCYSVLFGRVDVDVCSVVVVVVVLLCCCCCCCRCGGDDDKE